MSLSNQPTSPANVRAMLIKWVGDLPALCATCNVAEKGHHGACPECDICGRRGPGKKHTIYTGAYRECSGNDQRDVNRRGRGKEIFDPTVEVRSLQPFNRKNNDYYLK